MEASSNRVTLLVLVALLAATSSSCASALDLASSQRSNGRKFLLESAEQMSTTNSFPGASKAQQEREAREWAANQPNVDLTPETFSTKPRNTPLPPHGPAPGGHTSSFAANQPNFEFTPGTFSTKPRNTPVPPHGPAPGQHTNSFAANHPSFEFTPGTFSTKPRNTPVPPHGPAPGEHTSSFAANHPSFEITPGTFSTMPRNTPVPPHGPAPGEHTDTFFSRVSAAQKEISRTPGTSSETSLNTPTLPEVESAPGLFGMKPGKTPVSPDVSAPGYDTNTYFSRVSRAQKEREVNKGFNRGGAILLP